MRYGANVWLQSMRDRDYDVLVFGVLTALTGIERNTDIAPTRFSRSRTTLRLIGTWPTT
jgi:hypothetical protein